MGNSQVATTRVVHKIDHSVALMMVVYKSILFGKIPPQAVSSLAFKKELLFLEKRTHKNLFRKAP